MRVKIKNIVDGSISVDIEMNDTPKQIIAKAIAQNDEFDVESVFYDIYHHESMKKQGIDINLCVFSLETKYGIAPLDWDIPVGKQVKQQINQIINEGYDVIFYFTVTQYA